VACSDVWSTKRTWFKEMAEKAYAKQNNQDDYNGITTYADYKELLSKSEIDAVIIANALHIIPNPEKAVSEIRRVLNDDGILIAPNFTHKGMPMRGKIKSKIMSLVGFQTFAIWSPAEYIEFLENNGLAVTYSQVLQSSFPLTYTQAKKVKVNESRL
jgi:ubiquinone/menaquinone biosynthesis C-methylase UbiE